MATEDFRGFLRRLEDRGELARIKREVDTKFEISGYTLAAYLKGKLQREPALFFENVRGFDIPVVTNVFGTYKRFALALDADANDLFHCLVDRYDRMVEPQRVSTGPCKDHVMVADAVDLLKLPVMWWNEFDAGPYITAGVVITKDLNTGKHNAGRYRLQLKGKDRLGILLSERQHVGRHYAIARERGEKEIDVAIAIGVPPALELASVATIPYEWEEYAWAAGNTEPPEPIQLVRGESVDLYVPATSEFVIEGKIPIGEYEEEGPLGEFTGYYSGKYSNPVIHVTALSHRANPIMVGIHMANAPGENLLIGDYYEAVGLYREVKRLVPEVTGIRYLFSWYTIVAQVAKPRKYLGIARRVADAVWSNKVGSYCKTVIVVDDDVDIYNDGQIFWAMSVRTQPDADVWVSSNCPGYGIDPSERELGVRSIGGLGVSRVTSRLLWDATESLLLSTAIRVIDPPPGFETILRQYEEETTHS